MIWMTEVNLGQVSVSSFPAGLSGADVSGIRISKKSKIFFIILMKEKKISEKNPLANKISWSPIKGLFP